MIHVLADQNLYKIKELIPPSCHLHLYDPSVGIPHVEGIDALLVRTVTHINADTFPDIPSSLAFIGTGSSGTDHLDNDYLEQQGITLADAKGCNARSVAEYVMTALLLWREKLEAGTPIGKVGVIGVGKAGTEVVKLLKGFGIECVEYDPPREKTDPDFTSASLNEVLNCEILTFHTPLNKKGAHPTFHWLNEQKLDGRTFKLIINAARGGVIDERALLKYFEAGAVKNYILDVWENEPNFSNEIAEHAFIATPHIAGYSEQAKINATKIICDKLATHFGIEPAISAYKNVSKSEDLAHIHYSLSKILTRLHPIKGYDAALRDLFNRPDKKVLFRTLRNEWPYRYEYTFLNIRKELLDQFKELKKLGVVESNSQ